MAEMIIFASGKGGVGRSTVCVHVAAALARRGKRVLVLEACCGFRCLEILLGVPGQTVYDLSDALEGRCSLGEAILPHEASQLRLMPAPSAPDYLPEEERLSALLVWARDRWDHLLVDCGTGFGPMERMLARQCRRRGTAILVTTPEEAAVRCAARESALLAREGLAAQRLVINRVPRELVPTAAIRDLDDVIDLTGVQLLGAVPEQPGLSPPGEAPPETLAARELDAIARRLLGERAELVLYP